MENFSYHVPFYVVTGGIKTSGHSSELGGGQVGLYDRSTFSVATGIGTGKEFFFAQGPIGGKDWYGHPVTESHKSPMFYGVDIEDMYLSTPQRIQNEEWVLGYNGSPSSVGFTWEKGKATRVQFYFHGNPTYRFFAGPKIYIVSHTPLEDCTEPCNGDDCPEGIVDCLVETQKLIDKINQHTELPKFGVQAKIVVDPFSAAATTMEKYCITLCDNGTPLDLLAVQNQAPVGSVVTRTVRDGSQSTYQFCQIDDLGAPANFTQTGDVLQAVCDDCPAGSFLIPAKDVFIVHRPIVGGEDFSTAASRDTYANVVWSAYATSESITSTTSTTSTTTAAGTFNADATFVANAGGEAIVKLKFPQGTVLSPVLGADTVEFDHTEAAVCVFATPASTAWALCGTGISSSRTLRINGLNRPDCDADGDRLADLTTILAGVQGIDTGSLALVAGTGCADDYTVNQLSVDCLPEDCLTNNVTFTYDDLPAIEGKSWEVVPPTVVDNADRKCGIRITAGYLDPKFGNCSLDIRDYYETEPVKMEVSFLGEDDGACDTALWPTQHQSKVGRIGRQSGEWVIREVIMKTNSYLKHVDQFAADPRMREAFDMNLLGTVDRTAFYNLYYITYRASYGTNTTWRKNEQEKFTTVFAFKEGDASELVFQSQILDVLTAKSGKGWHVNEGTTGAIGVV